ncbi:hypothetical protein [Streptobacillus canis]|uniref:hypothetical protein n=1 Tax=Streptobacillus canis TaxID=2678686 RepID=UPI0012E2FF5F|nr:hypothetical protein [Streptobacillus canis]
MKKILIIFILTITLTFSNTSITELNKEIEELNFDTEKVLITVVGDNDYFFISADNKIVEYKYNLRYFSDGKNNMLLVRLPNKDVKHVDMVIQNNNFIEFDVNDLIECDNDLFQIVYLNDDYNSKKFVFDNLIIIKYYTDNEIIIKNEPIPSLESLRNTLKYERYLELYSKKRKLEESEKK